jgi:hypothetical protein
MPEIFSVVVEIPFKKLGRRRGFATLHKLLTTSKKAT